MGPGALFLAASLIVGLVGAAPPTDHVQIVTKPKPGEEYVAIRLKPNHGVEVVDEGRKGLIRDVKADGEELTILSRKTEGKKGQEKKETGLKDGKVELEQQSNSGVKTPHNLRLGKGDIAVPPQKNLPRRERDGGWEVIGTRGRRLADEGSYDFIDSPLPVLPAASAQASRTAVKKGPNGQDYEYEYVYYYYDDDEEAGGGGGGSTTEADKPTTFKPKVQTESRPATSYTTIEREKAPNTEVPTTVEPVINEVLPTRSTRGRRPQQGRTTEEVAEERLANSRNRNREEGGEERHRSRGREEAAEERGRFRGRDEQDEPKIRGRGRDDVEESRVRGRGRDDVEEPRVRGRGRDDVEESRVRGRGRDDVEEPRIRGRGRDDVEEPRSRSRGREDTTRSRGSAADNRQRNNPGSVKRPSLELVDSSSFRTHQSDLSPDPIYTQVPSRGGATRPRDPSEDEDEDEVEAAVRESATTLGYPPLPPQTTVPPQDTGMPDKAALDLYAILQQTQEENNVVGDYETTEEGAAPTTTQQPTTTTTTPPPTTTTTATTTTTTEAQPQPAFPGRRRIGGNRARQRLVTTPATTTEAPKEPPTRTNKFSPSRPKNPSQGSAYGRRGGRTTTAAPTDTAPAEQPPAPRPRARPSLSNRFKKPRTGVSSTTAEPQPEQPAAEDSTTTSSIRSRPRVVGSGIARPLRPGPRLGLPGGRARLQPATSTTSSPPPEPEGKGEEAEAEKEEVQEEPGNTTPGDPLSKLRTRNRLRAPRLPIGKKPQPPTQPPKKEEGEGETGGESEVTEAPQPGPKLPIRGPRRRPLRPLPTSAPQE